MEVVVTTGAIRRSKLQSKCHRQQTNTRRFTGRMPFCLQLYRCKKSIVVMYTLCVKCVTDIMVQYVHSCTIHNIPTLQVLAYVLCHEFLIVHCLLVRSKGAAMSHCSG